MKFQSLLFALILLPCLIFAQDRQDRNEACERETNTAANAIYYMMLEQNFENFDEVLADWKFFCAENEVMLRMQILIAIHQNENIENLAMQFIDGPLTDYNYRIQNAKSPNFQDYYLYNPAYYNFLPLRDPLDSLSQKFAKNLLGKQAPGSTEKLLCILFSEGFEAYEKALKRSEFSDSKIVTKLNAQKREKLKDGMFFLNAGVCQSLDAQNVIGLSYQIGAGGYQRLSDQWQMGIFVHYRLFEQKDDYNFIYQEDTLSVASFNSSSFGLGLRYKLYSNEELMFWPNLKVGAAQIYTDFDDEDGGKETLDAVHLMLGCDLLFPAFKNDLWALGLYYHYIPYSWNDRLLSQIEESYFSLELSYCF